MSICYLALGTLIHIPPYLDYFKNAGHKVSLVALTPPPELGVPTYNAFLPARVWKPQWKLGYLPAMLRARAIVRQLRPDILHAHYATSAGLAAYVCGAHPYVVTVHGTDVIAGVESALWRPILKRVLGHADLVNPVSDELRQKVLALGIPDERIKTLTLGIDPKRFCFREPRPSPDPLRLICTRHFEEVYDHRTILQGLAIAKSQGAALRLTLVGQGGLRRDLENLAGELGVSNDVVFVGTFPNSSLPAILAEHDLYLSASIHDGTSLSLLEAMASGLYPVVSDINANREWIRHGHNGLLHKVSDAHSLAHCLLTLCRRPGQFGRVLLDNRKLVLDKADRRKNMRVLEQVYRSLTSRVLSSRIR